MSDYLIPAAATLLPYLGGWAGSLMSRPNSRTWLRSLKQPAWVPTRLIPAVWAVLYGTMGYASYMVWRDGGGFSGDAATPLTWYAIQLGLNWLWAPVFFGRRNIKGGLAINTAMWGAIAGTMYSFSQVNRTAGYLQVPYLMWVTFAGVIQYRLWRDNPNEGRRK